MESANRSVSWQKAAGDASWPGEKEPLESGNKSCREAELGVPAAGNLGSCARDGDARCFSGAARRRQPGRGKRLLGFRMSLSLGVLFSFFFSHLNLIIHPKELPGDLFFGWKTAKILRKWIAKKQTNKKTLGWRNRG